MKNLICFCLLACVAFVPQKAEAQFGWLVDAVEFVGDVGGVCLSAAELGVNSVCAAAGATVEAAGQVATAGAVFVFTGGSPIWSGTMNEFCDRRFAQTLANTSLTPTARPTRGCHCLKGNWRLAHA